jgi:hypothetical protein
MACPLALSGGGTNLEHTVERLVRGDLWDTNLFIYLFEGQSDRAGRVVSRRRRMLARGDQLLTSTLTDSGGDLGEAARAGRRRLPPYEEALSREAVLVSFNAEAARVYAGCVAIERSERPMRFNSRARRKHAPISFSATTSGSAR